MAAATAATSALRSHNESMDKGSGSALPCCSFAPVLKARSPNGKLISRERYGFQAFDRTINFRWTLHQGVLFISPERVLVYQVNRSRSATKAGSARCQRRLRQLHPRNKECSMRRTEAKLSLLQLPTNAEFSKVLATHDGKFIVRTGDILVSLFGGLYASGFARDAVEAPGAGRSLADRRLAFR